MLIKETRIAYQSWYETDYCKSGWDTTSGWYFKDGGQYDHSWEIVKIISENKHGYPVIAIVEKLTPVVL